MKRLFGVVFVCLSACGGGSERLYLGTVGQTPDPAGTFSGFNPLTETSAFRSRANPDNGYSFAYGNVDASNVPSLQSRPGDRAQVLVVGVLPTTDMGTLPASGRAVWIGEYRLYQVTGSEQSSNPANWEERSIAGVMDFEVDFDADPFADDPRVVGTGVNHLILLEERGFGAANPSLTSGDITIAVKDGTGLMDNSDPRGTTDFTERNDLTLVGGRFSGELGEDGLVAVIEVDGPNIFLGGGVIADAP